MPLPSISNRVYETYLHVSFRRRVRYLLRSVQIDEMTPGVIADLCLRRVLTLQSEGRRTSFLHQREAVAAVTRSAVEATLIGLYALSNPDNEWIGRFQKSSLKDLYRSLRSFLPEWMDFDDSVARAHPDVAAAPGMYTLSDIADRIDASADSDADRIGRVLYDEFYVPLSNISVHTGGFSLGRYYSVTWKPKRRPRGVVPRRGLVRATDACASALAAAIATSRGQNAAWFARYARRQFSRANSPVPITMILFMLAAVPSVLRHLHELVPVGARLFRLARSDEYHARGPDEQAERVKALFDRTSIPRSAIDISIDAGIMAKLLDSRRQP